MDIDMRERGEDRNVATVARAEKTRMLLRRPIRSDTAPMIG
jgi:hypothetical protein